MTAADRLLSLSGITGTASALLLAIGAGATTGDALADYSGLTTGTASEHILTERAKSNPWGGVTLAAAHITQVEPPFIDLKKIKRKREEFAMMALM